MFSRFFVIKLLSLLVFYLVCLHVLFLLFVFFTYRKECFCHHRGYVNIEVKSSGLSFIIPLWLWCLTPLSTIVQLYIMAVSFIGGGNWSTQKKPPPCRKSLTHFKYHIMLYLIHFAMSGIQAPNFSGDRHELHK